MDDGNVKMAPKLFKQLYVILAPLGEQVVPCVYALLERKTRDACEDLLTAVERRCIDLGTIPSPEVIITEFEQSAMSAYRSVFGDNLVNQGCFYHLTQSTWLEVVDNGLSQHYMQNG